MKPELIEFISGLPGFRALNEEDVKRLLSAVKKRRWADGATIFKKGEPGDTLMILTQGRVCVPLTDAAGRVTTRRYFERGAVLGEIALLLEGERTADVLAEGEVRGLVLGREQVRALIRRYPPLTAFLTELLGERLERAGLNRVGKYTLLSTIGIGGSSRVYSALHPTLGRTVALKMLSHAQVLQPGFRDGFMKEARTIASLDHPNIVRVHDIEEEYATVFLVMEQVHGTTLAKMTADAGRRLDPAEALAVLRQLGSALRYAHQHGVVHRDVKPENVAVDTTGQVKLMDFGLARRVAPGEDLSDEQYFAGTPRYMAPEYIAGQPSDARVDIYALGVMAFEMVAGRRMFQTTDVDALLAANRDVAPPDLATLDSSLPEGLIRFVNEALRKNPAHRISDWARIESLLGGAGPTGIRETIMRIRYPASEGGRVGRLLEPVMDHLSERSEISVAVSNLTEHISGEQTVAFPSGQVSEDWVMRYVELDE